MNEVIAAFEEARDRGTAPDAAEWARQFPEVATGFLQFIRDRDEFSKLNRAPEQDTPSPDGSTCDHAGVQRGQQRSISLPAVIGDYELLQEIGRGGMGVIYKARQLRLNRLVALKMILAGTLASNEDILRFRLEAESAAQLQHPNIVSIHEIAEHEGLLYFSMDLVDGDSLATVVRDAPLSPQFAATVMGSIAHAVHFAHTKGIVHRDLKPHNILLDENTNTPRITDFGLAKRIGAADTLTATGQVLGTPCYMSPEQAIGKARAIGPLVDVYALGATLYFALTGRPPFHAETIAETIRAVLDQDVVPPRRLNASLPVDLDTICLKCLQKKPEHRYHSAAEVASDLRRYLRGEPITARPVSMPQRVIRWAGRNRALATAGSLAVVSIVTALLVSVISAVMLAEKEKAARALTHKEQQARAIATTREQEARLAAQQEHQARVDLESELYARNMQLARREYESANSDASRRLLDSCSNIHRRWEWLYLKKLLDTNRQGIAVLPRESIQRDITWILSMNWDSHGRLLAFGGEGSCIVVDPQSGHQKVHLEEHIGSAAQAFPCVGWNSSTGHLIAVAQNKIIIRDVAREVNIHDLMPHKHLHEARASPDGRRLAVLSSSEGSEPSAWFLHVLDWNSAKPNWTARLADVTEASALRDEYRYRGSNVVQLLFKPHQSLAWSSDSRFVLTACGRLQKWDAQTGSTIASVSENPKFHILSVSPDGKQLAASGPFTTDIECWDADTLAYKCSLEGHGDLVTGLAWRTDNNELISSSWDNTVRLWRIRDRQQVAVFHDRDIRAIAYNEVQGSLAIAGAKGITVCPILPKAPKTTCNTGSSPIYSLAWHPDSAELAALNGTGSVFRLTVSGDQAQIVDSSYLGGGSIGEWAALKWEPLQANKSRNFKLVAANSLSEVDGERRETFLQIWEPLSKREVSRILLSEIGVGLTGRLQAWSSAHSMIAIVRPDDTLRVYDCNTSNEVKNIPIRRNGRLAWRPHSSVLAVAQGCDLLLVDVLGVDRCTYKNLVSSVIVSISFSDDGDRICLGSSTGECVVVDYKSPNRSVSLLGHSKGVGAVAWHPNGDRIATCGYDNTVRIWDSSSGAEVYGMILTEWPQCVEWSRDGRCLAVGTERGSIDFWMIPREQ